ncbi:hypothetical protein [Fervidibacillus halotolerans]|uniref:Uncharacterized protein n=1 Tax=Fervidibacillus halotolerans TaxID=2980027 RepID=A0A9E8LZJ4_9BACI|nr:hypothetical protein [Fervidibacillus halotolerans]WAA12597.1 hypothetical protein OE105_00130 [Fervidibacillus halotolerans]
MMFTILTSSVFAEESLNDESTISTIELSQLDLSKGKFVQLNKPQEFAYDGQKEVLLGYFELPVKTNLNSMGSTDPIITPNDSWWEYDKFYVYDQGIVAHWIYLSNPYFIASIAKGMTYTVEDTVSGTLSATLLRIMENFQVEQKGLSKILLKSANQIQKRSQEQSE